MMRGLGTTRGVIAALAVITAIIAAIVWLAPDERALGDGIKSVYVHAALTWTAMAGLLAAGALGLALAISNRDDVAEWMDTVGWVALGFFILSVPASIASQLVNWNGIFLDEPRMQLSIRALAVFIIVQIANRWLPSKRLRGAALAATLAAVLIVLRFAPLVLHPKNPISASSSAPIQLTFAALFALSLSAASVIVWHVGCARKLLPVAAEPE
ncbi:MAG: hypothetical protein FJ030_05565 [Chloroflexi bacterium]|nr:hypothetical protein [Chloroflexota bacterium]